MGMYDNLKFEVPLPGNSRGLNNPGNVWQTKDFAKQLWNYRVARDGTLWVTKWDEYREESQISQTEEQVDYHGIIRFCDIDGDINSDDAQFIEYRGKFTDGRFVEAELIRDEKVGTPRQQ